MLFPSGNNRSSWTLTAFPDAFTLKIESIILTGGLFIFSPCTKLVNHYYNSVLTLLVNLLQRKWVKFYGQL